MNDWSEVSVMVGEEMCNITALTDTVLHCAPPEKLPFGYNHAGKLDANSLPRVSVRLKTC